MLRTRGQLEPRLPEHNVFLKSVSRGPTGRFGRRVWCRKGDTLVAITELYRAWRFYTVSEATGRASLSHCSSQVACFTVWGSM